MSGYLEKIQRILESAQIAKVGDGDEVLGL